MNLICSICGGREFREIDVLWPELIAEWQISAPEAAYVNRQQGCACTSCGANLRIVALGNAIRAFVRTDVPLAAAIDRGELADLRILDCNGADGISAVLAVLPGYHRADYPAFDMRALPFADASFDLVIHSDTLEHIEHPVTALEQCRRLLSAGGRLCFTVPIIHGRLTRNRAGLPASHHGDPAAGRDDFIVHTEFGADAWTLICAAGFTGLSFHPVDFPSAVAIGAWTDPPLLAAPSVEKADEHGAASPGETAVLAAPEQQSPEAYDQDGLRSVHNHEFMGDPEFKAAYARGVAAAGTDYMWHWRVHTGLWAARTASKLPGDFAEFGVNRGFLSSAIMQLLDWNSTGRRFYLLDTFAGVDERYLSEEDLRIGVIERNQRDIDSGFYTFDLAKVRDNFAEWPAARVIPGPVPETLGQIDSNCFAFAHIDMNCAPPEVAAAEFLWPKLIAGGLILLDDYAYTGYRSQKLAMDAFAADKGVAILSLPTGQGLIVKPPSGA